MACCTKGLMPFIRNFFYKTTKKQLYMWRFLSGMFLFMLILTACQSGTTTDDTGLELSQEQLDALLRNQSPKAPQQVSLEQIITQMESSLAMHPRDTSTLYQLARVYYDKYTEDSSAATLQKSINYYSQVIQLDPTYEKGHSYYNRMLAQLAKGDYPAALADIDAFVKANQGRTRVNYVAMQAEILYQNGQLEQACKAFAKAQTLAERDSLPIGNIGDWQTECDF